MFVRTYRTNKTTPPEVFRGVLFSLRYLEFLLTTAITFLKRYNDMAFKIALFGASDET